MDAENELTKSIIVLVDPNSLDTASLLFFLTINNKTHITNCSSREQILKTLARYFVKTEEKPNSDTASGLPVLVTHSFKQNRLFVPLKFKFINKEKISFDEVCTAAELETADLDLKDRPLISSIIKSSSDVSKLILKLIDNRYGPFFKINVEKFNNNTVDAPIALKDLYFLKLMPTLMDTIEYVDSVRDERSEVDITFEADRNSRLTASVVNEIIGENERSQLIDQETELELQRPRSQEYWDQNAILETNKPKIDKPKFFPEVSIPLEIQKPVSLDEASTPKPRPPMKFTYTTPEISKNFDTVKPVRVLENLKQVVNTVDDIPIEGHKAPVLESTKHQKKPYKLTSVVKLPTFDSNTIDLPKQYLDRFLRTLEINLSVGTIDDLPVNHIKHLLAENIKQKDKSERFIDITKSAASMEEITKGFLEAVSVPIQIKQKQFEAISSKPEGLSWAEFALSVINKFKNTYDNQDLNNGDNEFLLAQFMKTIPRNLKVQLQGYLLTTQKRNIYDISEVLDLIQANSDADSLTEKLRLINKPKDPVNQEKSVKKSEPKKKFNDNRKLDGSSNQKVRFNYSRQNNNSANNSQDKRVKNNNNQNYRHYEGQNNYQSNSDFRNYQRNNFNNYRGNYRPRGGYQNDNYNRNSDYYPRRNYTNSNGEQQMFSRDNNQNQYNNRPNRGSFINSFRGRGQFPNRPRFINPNNNFNEQRRSNQYDNQRPSNNANQYSSFRNSR